MYVKDDIALLKLKKPYNIINFLCIPKSESENFKEKKATGYLITANFYSNLGCSEKTFFES